MMRMKALTTCCVWAGLIVGTGSAFGENPNATPTVVRVCVECHGTEGNSQVPGWPALRSMSYKELKTKLEAYRAGQLPDSRMTDVSHILDDAALEQAARYYAKSSSGD